MPFHFFSFICSIINTKTLIMKEKLKLEDLKLESFVTELDNSFSFDIKGGKAATYGACDNTGKTLDCSGWLCDSTDVSQQSECETCGRECGVKTLDPRPRL